MSKTPHQKKLAILYQEYDANLAHLNKLRKLNAWNPLPERLSEHGQYVMWHRSLLMQILTLHFEAINQAQERTAQRAQEGTF